MHNNPPTDSSEKLNEPSQAVYFIGITLPAALGRQISELQWCLFDEEAHLIKPVLPHVTLLHPPSLEGILPSQLLPRIHEIASRYLPMTIQLRSINFFGTRVCFLEAESLKLHSLQMRLVHTLPPAAQTLHYKRPYHPHVTLAQAYNPHALRRPALLKAISSAISLPLTFTVDSVACFTRIKPRIYHTENIN
jgi:2'-5' RNA ligase